MKFIDKTPNYTHEPEKVVDWDIRLNVTLNEDFTETYSSKEYKFTGTEKEVIEHLKEHYSDEYCSASSENFTYGNICISIDSIGIIKDIVFHSTMG